MLTIQEVEQLAKHANVIPLVKTILADLHTPVSAYAAVRDPSSPSFLFESVEPDEKIGRYSFIGLAPRGVLSASGETVEWRSGGPARRMEGDFFQALKGLASQYRQAEVEGVSGFLGGFVGYIGYECVRSLERLPPPKGEEAPAPDAMMGLFDTVIRFDHRSHWVTLVAHLIVDPSRPLPDQYEETRRKLEALALRLRNTGLSKSNFHREAAAEMGGGRGAFLDAVEKAKRYIVEGDIFQVVLSRGLRVPYSGDPFPVYRALRVINPSPYLFYVDFGGVKLIGSSPEVLVRVQGRGVTVMPIAGTRPRGGSEEADRRLAEELMADEKELAEHLMLVDLGRHDVGRVSEMGSVTVPVFKRLERYSHVMHLVSEVKGRLRAQADAVDAFTACFPAGTVSGAPKVRAMEIINELEPSRRGIYAGAVGYLGFEGSLDMCIAIRTIVAAREMLYLQSGAGVVADSSPEREYEETVNKAKALEQAVDLAAGGWQE